MIKTLLIWILSCCAVIICIAQVPTHPSIPASNLRKKIISTRASNMVLDSLSIIPNTVRIQGIDDSSYTIDYINARISWKQAPLADSVWISYRVFKGRLNAVNNRLKYDSIMNFFLSQPEVLTQKERDEDNFFNFGNINYSGSFGRGISFGNSQDAVVTSNLNLQLSGYLADSIQITAAITDNNIPIQPDGTTQQLNEFDRIFLQFKKRDWQLSLGDIDLRQNNSYFLNFYKRLQGAAFESTQHFSSKITNNTLVSGSIAKGKFTRNIIQPLEGNQGPYRLQGANNEFFFVVLANTERVYIDGELLQRGEDQDYVINYNTAEITFTPRRMINRDRRIQVEFEYADRNYLNANLYLSNETNFNNKLRLRVGMFSNSDAKNSPLNQSLDANQKQFLNSIGDSINKAYYPVATLDTFAAGKILYKQVDSTADNSIYSIFIYSTNPDSARYSLNFSDVGEGNGDYVPDFNGANGKVFKWIAPINGVKQGRFEPAIFLVTPKLQRIINLGLDYNLTKNTTITTEVAYSKYDINTFSKKDKTNDNGYAARMQIKNTHPFSSLQKWQLITTGGFEYVDARFKPLERLRNVEFTRDWGLALTNIDPANELLYNAGVQLTNGLSNNIAYNFIGYNRGNSFKGYRNTIVHQQKIKGWRFNNQLSLTNANSTLDKGYFFRPTIDVAYQFAKLKNYTLGSSYSVEHNEIKNKLTDTLNPNSFSFDVFQVYLKSDEQKPNKWGVTYYTRTNRYPFYKGLEKTDYSSNINLYTELLKNERHQFRFTATYRVLQVLKSFNSTSQQSDKSLLGRAEYLINEWNGVLIGSTLYETGSGQEQKRDFAYLEVPAGQGQYTWIDYNNDGVQQLNEFELAAFPDQAKYIRIFTPTNEFIKANYNTFNYSISLNPRAAIDVYTVKGMRKMLANLNFQSSLQLSKKEIAKGLIQLNPFANKLNDTSLINLSQIFVNILSFNRFSTVWGLDLNNTRNSNKVLLTYGLESRNLNDWSAKGRWNFTKSIMLDMTVRKAINTLRTANAKFDRNYYINHYALEPRISFTKGSSFRVTTGYRFSDKKNREGDLEKYTSHSLNTEVKYNILQSSTIQTKFTYSNIHYVGNANSTAGYIILDGLLPGKNFLWNVDLTKRLSNNLEINIQYEGRKPGDTRMIHVGRAAIRAIL